MSQSTLVLAGKGVYIKINSLMLNSMGPEKVSKARQVDEENS